ncbi:MAG TPA: histidine kinase [Abditibacteriaceae bacterium]|jgi:signal transduction histidine kinase
MNKSTAAPMIALMRLLLTCAAFPILFLSELQSNRDGFFVHYILIAYGVYSAVIYVRQVDCWSNTNNLSLVHRPCGVAPWWIDIAWSTSLLAFGGGANSPFFLFYIFAIISTSFQCGFQHALRATAVSALLFSLVGFFTVPPGQELVLSYFSLRLVCLLILGYSISAMGGSEMSLRRHLCLLSDMNSLSNPRLGIDRTLGALTERLRDFYDADKCTLVMAEWNQMEPHLRSAIRAEPEAAMKALPLTPPMRHQLLTLPDTQTVWQSPSSLRTECSPRFQMLDLTSGKFFPHDAASGDGHFESLSTALDVEEYFSSPLCYRGTHVGRVFVSGPQHRFDSSEATFLLQAIDHVMPLLDNTLLLDRLASDAAKEERQRIARDLHDSIIQPYIGLQIGLTALYKELDKDAAVIERHVQHLLEMTNMGIDELYDYVARLKHSGGAAGDLKSSLERFITKFSAATMIQVEIEIDATFKHNDRLAAEVFQMICEGLSNIRRHTNASHALIQIKRTPKNLELQITNARSVEAETGFTPRSILGRAIAMGGTAGVKNDGNNTTVHVTIPL